MAWLWKCVLALAGCIAGAWIGQGLIGGAIGAAVTGVIAALSCYPLLRSLVKYRQARDSGK